MRYEIDKFKSNNYTFITEIDHGGDPEFPYTVWVYYNNKPLLTAEDYQVRRDFGSNASIIHIHNFCKKFSTDEKYRNDFISRRMT